MLSSILEEEKPPALPVTASVSSIVDEGSKALSEEEKLKLYQQLDDKDEEINNLSHMIDILKEKILEQENLISMQQLDYEILQQEITRLQADNDLTKDKDGDINELSQMIERLKEKILEQENIISVGKRDYEALQQNMDGEITELSQMIERLREQMLEQEDLISLVKRDYETLQQDMMGIQADNDSAKDEVKELSQALEELNKNYDLKSQEVENKTKENETIVDELNTKLSELDNTEAKLRGLRYSSLDQREKMTKIIESLMKDMSTIGSIVGANFKFSGGTPDKLEEDYTVARIYMTKIKSDIKTLVSRAQQLEVTDIEVKDKLWSAEKELSDCKLTILQYEAKMSTLNETIKDIDSKKKQLQETVDSLNVQVEILKMEERMHLETVSEREKEASDRIQHISAMKESLEKQMEQHRRQHAKHLSELREEVAEKQSLIDQLKDTYQKLSLALEKLQADYDKLKTEETEKSQKLQELSLQIDRREQAKQDLKGLEESVAKELQTLHNLRELFVQDLQNRVKISANKKEDEDDDDTGGNMAQKQKISFLENNLEQLTKVYRQVVRDNADLRCELPKLEKRLRATMERTKSLETALKEAKEDAMRDRKRLETTGWDSRKRLRESRKQSDRRISPGGVMSLPQILEFF